MRKLVSLLMLSLAAAPVFAGPGFNVPEPESLALLAIGSLAFLVSRRGKK
jgi:hypothetical protein